MNGALSRSRAAVRPLAWPRLRWQALTPPRLVVALALAGIFAMAARPSVDTDTWWHLRSGAWMVEHRQILTHDEFSSTRAGQPWINHSWLAQLPLYGLWRAFGYAGLNLATALVVTAAFWLIYRQMSGSAYLKAFTLVLAAAASHVYWSARPQLLSFLLAAVVTYLLHLFRWRGVNRLWLLPLLMLLWVNLHGGFAIGFLLLLITLAGQAASRLLGARGPGVAGWDGLLKLAGVVVACAAVVVVNPYGPALYLYPLRTVSIGALQDFIQEWQSPNFHLRAMQLFIWLSLAVLAALGLSRRRIDLTDFALLGGFTYLALLAARNIPIAALVAAPIITRHAADGLTGLWASHPRLARLLDPPPSPRTAFGLNWALLALVLLAVLVKAADASLASTNARALQVQVPLGAVRYLQAARPPGPLFNAYNWGGYLTWALYPDYPVFVDGRTDLYDDALLREYLQAALGRPGYEGVLDRRSINLVLIEHQSYLDEHLRVNPRWRLVYEDETAVVYQRLGSGAEQ
jgi:hypothetical protein